MIDSITKLHLVGISTELLDCVLFLLDPDTIIAVHLVYDSFAATLPESDHGFETQCVKTTCITLPGRITPMQLWFPSDKR
jgi:hypothetical protein